MSWPLAILIAVSVAASAFGYWRALRLHRKVTAIDPHFCDRLHDVLGRFLDRRSPHNEE